MRIGKIIKKIKAIFKSKSYGRSGSLAMVMVGLSLIAAGAFGMFFVRVFFGSIGLVENVLPIPDNSTLASMYTNYVEPALTTFIQISVAVIEIFGIVILVRALWGLLPLR